MLKRTLSFLLLCLMVVSLTLAMTACGDSESETPAPGGNPEEGGEGPSEGPGEVYSQGLTYTVNSDETTCTITGIGTCTDASLLIPPTIDGYTVTVIGRNAFAQSNLLRSVVVPDTVIAIQDYAFQSCRSLAVVRLGESVQSIGQNAFASCTNLVSINLPATLNSVGTQAFAYCFKLVEVINNTSYSSQDLGEVVNYAVFVHEGESLIAVEGEYLFCTINDVAYLMAYVGQDTVITLPNTFRGNSYQLYKYAFARQDFLTQVTLPIGPTSIPEGAFMTCYNLTEVNVPQGVTVIGETAFSSCTSLLSMSLPHSVTVIQQNAFSSCTSMTSLTLSQSLTTIGESAFWDCNSLTTLVLPASLTRIDPFAFQECTDLVSVTFEGEGQWILMTDPLAAGGQSVDVSIPDWNDNYLRATYDDKYWIKM